ncbi:MAG: phosphodiester glycosidase family protein [Deinococcales bacterium]
MNASSIDRRTVLKALLLGSTTLLFERFGTLALAQTENTPLLVGTEEIPLGTGLRLSITQRVDARGWLRSFLLEVDLSDPAISTDLLFGSVLTSAEKVSSLAARAGAVAAINGDFFDINNSKAPVGAVLRNGELLKSGLSNWSYAGIDATRTGRIFELQMQARFRVAGGNFSEIRDLNSAQLGAGSLALYTAAWASEPSSIEASGARTVAYARITSGRVVETGELEVLNNRIALPALDSERVLLLGREAGAERIKTLKKEDLLEFDIKTKIEPNGVRSAVGGNLVLVQNGVVNTALNSNEIAARSAIGFSRDGKTMYFAVVDGKQASSRGMSLAEFAQYLLERQVFNALNIDGGGSSTLVARQLGAEQATLQNSPSDLEERPVANAFAVFVRGGSRTLRQLEVRALGASDRIFPGLQRRHSAVGSDERGTPVNAGGVQWSLEGDGSVDTSGTVRAGKPGQLVLRARQGEVSAQRTLRVLGELVRVFASLPRLTFVGRERIALQVLGADAEGFAAPLEAGDLSIEYDQTLIALRPTDTGFEVAPLKDSGATLLSIKVRSRPRIGTFLPITVGLRSVRATDFADAAAWSSATARAVATLTPVPTRSGNGLRLSFDFSGTCSGCSTGTRAAYIRTTAAAPFFQLPGQPLRLGVWVRSADGRLPWLRAALRHSGNLGADTVVNLTPEYQQDVGKDWVYVEGTVPAGIQYPLYLRQIYPVETLASRVYKGTLDFDSLFVKVAPDLEVPSEEPFTDALIAPSLDTSRWRFAVLNDAHLFASGSGGFEAQLTRAALRQIRASKPDLLVIAGDFIENGTPEDFAFAKALFAEELGSTPPFPVYYMPGNHELFPQTTGSINNYTAAGYKLFQSFDHRGVRFILLNTANARLHTPDVSQLLKLDSLLQDAKQNPNIEHVMVFGHHPAEDPKPPFDRKIGSLQDVDYLRQQLTRFVASCPKGVVYHSGHAHYANVQRFDGVPLVIAPASGKAPYTAPRDGGFNGWMLYGVRPKAPRHDWLRAEMRPVLERVRLELPEQIQVGQSVQVVALGEQLRGLQVPLRYPVSVQWSGTSLTVGRTGTRAFSAALLDPVQLSLTGLRPGVTTVELRVAGFKLRKTVTVVKS